MFHFDGRAAQAVKRLKYARVTSLACPMANLLESVRGSLPEHEAVVPVPIHPSRLRWRGFNQSDLLTEAVPRELVKRALMVRVKKTRPQVELGPNERIANLRGAFRADPSVKGLHVLLVDDVMTTGGTAIACAEALKEAGALEVGLLTFCGERLVPTYQD
jgi:ComF family protein